MNKQKKLSIYQDIRKELLEMREGEEVALFAPNGEENVIRRIRDICGEPTFEQSFYDDFIPCRIPALFAELTKDILKYWEQNPEEAKASGLL